MGIGINNMTLFHIKNDLENFKTQTMGNVVIMGRMTYESLPQGKPLDGRINIIITKNKDYSIEPCDNAFIVHSIEDAVDICHTLYSDKEWFVIGGEEIYAQFMALDLVDEMRMTFVNDTIEADKHFPTINKTEWRRYYRSMAQTWSCNGVERSFYFEVLKKTI